MEKQQLRIAVSGASGFVGKHLTAYLETRGHRIVPLGRADFAESERDRLAERVAACDAVVNLAGAPIDRRWTPAYREELMSSRIDTTRRLVAALGGNGRTRTLLSASAVGWYPSVGCYDEYSTERGRGFLADLCRAWEAEAQRAPVRCAVMRFGVVLAADGGAFPRLARPAKAGLGVVAGGSQSFSWIDIADLVRAVEFLLLRPWLKGVFNFAAPEKSSMREFVRAVAKHYRTRLTLSVPSFAVRLALGEAASFLLQGQCVEPFRLTDAGFRFESPAVADFLRKL